MLSHISKSYCRLVAVLALAGVLGACVYKIDIQQGNLLEQADIEAIKPGMTRSQVRFLLGTPVVQDSFHRDRWDYVYYFKKGRAREADRRWLIVYFDGDRVRELRPDVPLSPS